MIEIQYDEDSILKFQLGITIAIVRGFVPICFKQWH